MIWLIGGTSDSVKIAELLSQINLPLLVSITTNNAQNLYSHIPNLRFFVGKITPEQLPEFLTQNKIKIIIDASHPYATIISENVITVAKLSQIPYLRYERPLSLYFSSQIIEFSSINELLISNYLGGKRVLLTLGYKSLGLFSNYHNQAQLYARILPYPESITAAIQAGFTSERLIAIRPPLSIELEKALWQLWSIKVVVTKASGDSGGEDIKRQVSEELKIPLVVISRPKINYSQMTFKLEDVVEFCSQYF
jgi:precorrin-6A/cobalt-precorrin-6A reductase